MSEAAVIAESAPAPAPVEGGAAINENPASYTHPLGSQIPAGAEAKPEAPAQPKSIDDSIDRAIAKSAAVSKDAPKVDAKVPEAKPEPKVEQPRENGKFAAAKPAAEAVPAQPVTPKPAEAVKPSHTAEDAPSRFTDTAKAKWAAADPELRGEVLRMQKELTDGYQKHKQAAERDAGLTEFHEMAAKHGTDVKTALSRYVGLENLLRQDFVKGLEQICANKGVSLKDVAAHIMGQTPEQNASQQDTTIRELRQELSTIKEQVGGVTQTIQQQREQSTLTEINAFAKEHPRFDELANDIAFFMQSGRAKDLPEAYTLAERLNPASASASAPAASSAAPAAASPAAINPTVQPGKGQKSINGAPSSGSTPAGKKRVALSLDESLDRAFGSVG